MNLKKIRKGLGYSQLKFAELAGIHQTSVSHIEVNAQPVSIAYAQTLEVISRGAYPWVRWFPFENKGVPMYAKEFAPHTQMTSKSVGAYEPHKVTKP